MAGPLQKNNSNIFCGFPNVRTNCGRKCEERKRDFSIIGLIAVSAVSCVLRGGGREREGEESFFTIILQMPRPAPRIWKYKRRRKKVKKGEEMG